MDVIDNMWQLAKDCNTNKNKKIDKDNKNFRKIYIALNLEGYV